MPSDKKGVQALKDGLAEAMGTFAADRTVLPIPDRNFGGTIGRALERRVSRPVPRPYGREAQRHASLL